MTRARTTETRNKTQLLINTAQPYVIRQRKRSDASDTTCKTVIWRIRVATAWPLNLQTRARATNAWQPPLHARVGIPLVSTAISRYNLTALGGWTIGRPDPTKRQWYGRRNARYENAAGCCRFHHALVCTVHDPPEGRGIDVSPHLGSDRGKAGNHRKEIRTRTRRVLLRLRLTSCAPSTPQTS